MNKPIFHWINEWKKVNNVRILTPIHLHFSWCKCGCHEVTMFFIFMSLGFFVTINPKKKDASTP